MLHLLPLSRGTAFWPRIQNAQTGLKTLVTSLSLAVFGIVTLLKSVFSRIYGVLACTTARRKLEARVHNLKVWTSRRLSGNADCSLHQTCSSSPVPSKRKPGLKALSLPLHSQSCQAPTSRFVVGPGPFIRKIISLAQFKKQKSEERRVQYVDRELKRGVSCLDISISPTSSPHRTSSSTDSNGHTIVSISSSIATPNELVTEHNASDMPYRELPTDAGFNSQGKKSNLYTRRPSNTEKDDEHTIHVVPNRCIRPSLTSPKSPVCFHNPFGTVRPAPTRQKPRPRRNPKLALTLSEFFSSRNNAHGGPITPANPQSSNSTTAPSEREQPMYPWTIQFPPRRYSRTSYIPQRRGSHTYPNRATSPEPSFESLPVPPSWRRPRQPSTCLLLKMNSLP